MTFLEYIDSAPRVGINHIPKNIAPLLLELNPDRFPNDPESSDSIQQAVEYCNGNTFNCDFKYGLQYSFLSIRDYHEGCMSFIDDYIEWSMLEFNPCEISDDPDIIFENII